MPHGSHDVEDGADAYAATWARIVKTVSERTTSVLKVFGLDNATDFHEFAKRQLGTRWQALSDSGLELASGLFLPFRSRNMATLLGRRAGSGSRIRAFTHAIARGWGAKSHDGAGSRLEHAEAVSSNGNRLRIFAGSFVVAAGAIESTRLLLELAASHGAIRSSAAVGRYLGDHLSLAIAEVCPGSRDAAIRAFAPRFSAGCMRDFRFIESPRPSRSPRAFAHFVFDNRNPGFHMAKEILRAGQSRRWPDISPKELFLGLGGAVALLHSRYLRSSLHVPKGTSARLQLDMEQRPHADNRIELGTEKDRYGRARAQVHWRIREEDLRDLHSTADRILGKWPAKEQGLPALIALGLQGDVAKPHDAYHPVGTCRMGEDSEAVTDPDLKVHGVSNLWVVSTGVLPTAGTANPTFTMLCLADALHDRLTNEQRRRAA
jgi:choline dehydrogenase-like flavoprotein